MGHPVIYGYIQQTVGESTAADYRHSERLRGRRRTLTRIESANTGRPLTTLREQMEDLRQQQLETFGGIGRRDILTRRRALSMLGKRRSWRQGDGLQGLQDHFDEFLNEWFVKQATMRVAGRMLEPLFKQIDNAVDQYGTGGTSVLMSELQREREVQQ